MTPDHDVLTRRGWVGIANVTLADEVACCADGYLTYEPPTAVWEYDHDGQMYEIESQQISQCVTLNHRMYVKLRSTRADNDFQLVEAQKIFGKRVQYKKDAILLTADIPTITMVVDNYPDIVVNMDHWLDLLGVVISDGWVDRENRNRIMISAKKERKMEHIFNFCVNLDIDVHTSGDKHYFKSPHMWKLLEPICTGASNKYLPNYVFNVSQRQAKILLESLISGDGHVDKKGNMMYFTSSKRLADDVMGFSITRWLVSKFRNSL